MIILGCLIPFDVCADAPSGSSSQQHSETTSKLALVCSNSQIPRKHGSVYLDCRYSSEYVYIQFPIDVISMEYVFKEGEEIIEQGTITNDNPYIRLLHNSNSLTLVCITDQNQTFKGQLYF